MGKIQLPVHHFHPEQYKIMRIYGRVIDSREMNFVWKYGNPSGSHLRRLAHNLSLCRSLRYTGPVMSRDSIFHKFPIPPGKRLQKMEFEFQKTRWSDTTVHPALRIFKKCSKIQSFSITVVDDYLKTRNTDNFLLRVCHFLKYNKNLQQLHISYRTRFSTKSLEQLLHRISKLRNLEVISLRLGGAWTSEMHGEIHETLSKLINLKRITIQGTNGYIVPQDIYLYGFLPPEKWIQCTSYS